MCRSVAAGCLLMQPSERLLVSAVATEALATSTVGVDGVLGGGFNVSK